MHMPETLKDPKKIAIMLLKATALPDEQVFMELATPKYTTVDYYRMACHMLFECQRCGKCCTSGDPIRLRPEDAAALAKHLKIPLNKAIKKYTIPDPEKPGALDFKHTKPCKFYDVSATSCKLYTARPWSCRIFPFLGIYGSEEQVIVNKSCPGSMKTMEILTAALKEVRAKMEFSAPGLTEVRQNKELLRAVLESV